MAAIVIMMCAFAPLGQAESKDDPKALLELIESLQSRVEDFRCEFEGTTYLKSEDAKKNHRLGEEGLYDTFSGIFIWKSNGDTYSSTIHKHEPDGRMTRESLVIRARKNEAEHYIRPNDAPIGRSYIQDPSRVNANRPGCFGSIFLVDEIRRMMKTGGMACSVSDGLLEGRQVKVLSFSFQKPNQLYRRYWIDLARGGHAVRREEFAPGDALVSRSNIKLKEFDLNG